MISILSNGSKFGSLKVVQWPGDKRSFQLKSLRMVECVSRGIPDNIGSI